MSVSMIPVATWVFEPYLNRSSILWSLTSHMLVSAKLAIDNVYKLYGKPRIYTDTLGREILRQLTKNADYIVCYDNAFKEVSDHLWMYPKLLTYQQQTEAYFHFDLDLICFKHFSENIFSANVVAHNTEIVTEELFASAYNLNDIKDYYLLPEIFYRSDVDQVPVYNVGFLYIDDLKFNREYADTAISIIDNNLDTINNRRPMISPCTVEQQTLGLMLRDRPDLRVETLVDLPNKLTRWNNEFIHFFAWGKNHLDPRSKKWHELRLAPYVDQKILSIARSIDYLIEFRKNKGSVAESGLSR